MTFADNFEEIITALNVAKVNYMVVGGYAVNFHGYERSTSDLDVWVKPSEENKYALYNALLSLDYQRST